MIGLPLPVGESEAAVNYDHDYYGTSETSACSISVLSSSCTCGPVGRMLLVLQPCKQFLSVPIDRK